MFRADLTAPAKACCCVPPNHSKESKRCRCCVEPMCYETWRAARGGWPRLSRLTGNLTEPIFAATEFCGWGQRCAPRDRSASVCGSELPRKRTGHCAFTNAPACLSVERKLSADSRSYLEPIPFSDKVPSTTFASPATAAGEDHELKSNVASFPA